MCAHSMFIFEIVSKYILQGFCFSTFQSCFQKLLKLKGKGKQLGRDRYSSNNKQWPLMINMENHEFIVSGIQKWLCFLSVVPRKIHIMNYRFCRKKVQKGNVNMQVLKWIVFLTELLDEQKKIDVWGLLTVLLKKDYI